MNIAPLLYRNTMVEVKQRFQAIDRILGAKKSRTLTEEFDNEFMWLQIRKIVELTVFGGVMADEARYAALRAEAPKNPDYTRDSKVNTILPKLAEITPHYLPRPLGEMTSLEDGTKHFLEGKEQETIDRFLHIFNLAGLHLHVPNPLGFETLAEFHTLRLASREELEVELSYLKGVLWQHVKIGLLFDPTVDKPRDNANPDNAWLVYFGRTDVEEIQMAIAKTIPVKPEDE
jgi:hypothetical protein